MVRCDRRVGLDIIIHIGNEVEGRGSASTTILVCSRYLQFGSFLAQQFAALISTTAEEDRCTYAASSFLITLLLEVFLLNSFYREPL